MCCARLSGLAGAPGADVEIALDALNVNAVAADDVVIGAEQEMNLMSGPAKARPIEAAEGAAADDGDFHRNYWEPRMASLAAWAMRNLSTLFAGMFSGASVLGLWPLRALR